MPEDPDLEYARSMVGDDDEAVSDVIDVFLFETPDLVRSIREGFDKGDTTEIRNSAHKLRSAIQIFSLPETVRLTQSIESSAANSDLAELSKLVEQLSLQLNHVMDRLRAVSRGESS